MSTASTTRPKRARAPRSATTSRSTTATARTSSQNQRHAMIAASAYLRAERRGFQGGDPVADWLESEREVDTLLSRQD